MIRQLEKTNSQLIELSKESFSELRVIYSPNKLAKELKGSLKSNWISFGYFASDKLVAQGGIMLWLFFDQIELPT